MIRHVIRQFFSGCIAGWNFEMAVAVGVAGVGHREHTVPCLPVSMFFWLQRLQAPLWVHGGQRWSTRWAKLEGSLRGDWCMTLADIYASHPDSRYSHSFFIRYLSRAYGCQCVYWTLFLHECQRVYTTTIVLANCNLSNSTCTPLSLPAHEVLFPSLCNSLWFA